MVQLEQKENIEKSFINLKYCGDNQSYQTRAVAMKLLDTPLFKTEKYRTHLPKYNCIIVIISKKPSSMFLKENTLFN